MVRFRVCIRVRAVLGASVLGLRCSLTTVSCLVVIVCVKVGVNVVLLAIALLRLLQVCVSVVKLGPVRLAFDICFGQRCLRRTWTALQWLPPVIIMTIVVLRRAVADSLPTATRTLLLFVT